mmetsp:Transcript_12702/g.44781  ORF Transcript_12702/g.44781 Transcript_12702/m.44781 type:complete len:130 (+) Transcript_12702:1-390(+)
MPRAQAHVGRRADLELAAYSAAPRRPKVLDSGLWRLCRHPNHLGEQVWWVGVSLFAVSAGGAWPDALGFLFNHVLDTCGTLPLIRTRMLARPQRAHDYAAYMHQTPLVYPTAASVQRWWTQPRPGGKTS